MKKQDDLNNCKPFELEDIINLTDEEISYGLERLWESGDFDATELTDEERETMFANISSRISASKDEATKARHGGLRFVKKAMIYAAALLLPILLFSTLYFYWQANSDIDCISTIATGRGEMATVTLPDGSVVKINNESCITYNPYSFAKGKREVSLEGEAFFDVRSDAEHPFSVSVDGLTVNVLGTKFNVNARKQADPSVYLEEGSVRLTAADESIVMIPGQIATYDSSEGVIAVVEAQPVNSATAWLNNEMVFSDQPIAEVVKTVEQYYGVEFDKEDISRLPDDGFTGTLPGDDIAVVLDVLEDVYNVKFTLRDRKIVIAR